MNLKNYLRLKAEKDAESLLTEEDEKFIQQLVQKYDIKDTDEKFEKQKRKNKKDK